MVTRLAGSCINSIQLALRGSACSFCSGKLIRFQPLCHSHHSVPLFSRTRITGRKAQSGGFALANIHQLKVNGNKQSHWSLYCHTHCKVLWRGTSAKCQESALECEMWIRYANLNMYQRAPNYPVCPCVDLKTVEPPPPLGTVHTAPQTSAKQAAPYDWQTPSLPVYVALHLFAPSLGYFSRRSHVWASACVPCIQMEAAVCKVSVRGEFIRGSGCLTSVWHKKSE